MDFFYLEMIDYVYEFGLEILLCLMVLWLELFWRGDVVGLMEERSKEDVE